MDLVDANVFLEVILAQENEKKCRAYLQRNRENLCISDFTLHSIGVILFRNRCEDKFQVFVEDLLGNATVLSLPITQYANLPSVRSQWGFDFDDSYQYAMAKAHGLRLVTKDKDFEASGNEVEVLFL